MKVNSTDAFFFLCVIGAFGVVSYAIMKTSEAK